MSSDDALLLVENAVTVLNAAHQAESLLADAKKALALFALQADITARAIQLSPRLADLHCINYDDFVQLAIQHHVTCYWK